MATQTNPELEGLQELERRMIAGDPAITPDVAAKIKTKLGAYRLQGETKPLGNPIPEGAAKGFEGQLGIYGTLKRSAGGFKDDYAGNTLTGGMENTAQGLFGTGTPGQRDWWANFQSTDNQIRNELFGSALTDTEKRAYEGTTITPRMDPAQIKTNLARREEIIKGALARRYDFMKANGYSPDAIKALAGEYAADFEAPAAPPPPPASGLPPLAGTELSPGGDKPQGPLEVDVGGADVSSQSPEFRAGLEDLLNRNASRDEIIAYWEKNAAKAAPVSDPSLPQSPDTGTGLGAAAIGAANTWIPGGLDEVSAAASTVLPGPNSMWANPNRALSDTFGLNLQQAEGAKQDIAAARPGAYMAGQIGGLALGEYALGKAFPGLASSFLNGGRAARIGRMGAADAAYGAAYGAGENNNNRMEGAITGGIAAPLAGAAGRATVTAASRLLAPAVKSTIKTLRRAGIQGLTPGQIGGEAGFLGRVVKGFEDRMAGLPLVGDVITSARRDTIDQLNRVAIDEALAPIGAKLPADKEIGSEAISWAQDAASQAYEQALGPLQAQADEALGASMTAVNAKAMGLPTAQRELFQTIVEQDVMPFVPETGAFSGKQIQAIKQGIDANIASLRSGSPADRKLAEVLDEAKGGFMDFAARAAPEEAAAFRAADDAYANLVVLEKAAAKASGKGGVFTPQQLSQAVREADRSVRKRATAGGRARMQETATAASAVLPSSVPDSGTAGRGIAALMGLGAVGGGGLGYADGGTSGAATGAATGAALLAAPYSRAGRRTIQSLFTGERGRGLTTLGEMLERQKAIGGTTGIGATLPYLSGE